MFGARTMHVQINVDKINMDRGGRLDSTCTGTCAATVIGSVVTLINCPAWPARSLLSMVVGTRGFRLVLNKAWLVVFLTTNVFTAFFTIVYMKIDDRKRLMKLK